MVSRPGRPHFLIPEFRFFDIKSNKYTFAKQNYCYFRPWQNNSFHFKTIWEGQKMHKKAGRPLSMAPYISRIVDNLARLCYKFNSSVFS